MNVIYQSAFFEALGWSLMDSFWQMGLLWVLYSLFTLNGNKYSSSKRHNLALLAVCTGTIWFAAGFALNYYYAVNDRELYGLSHWLKLGISNVLHQWSPLDSAVPFLSLLYLLSVTLFFARLIIQFTFNKHLFNRQLELPDEVILNSLRNLSQKIGLNKKIGIWLSEKIESPLTIGFWKPLILLPVAALNQLSIHQAEAVIAHELFHIKRNDYLLNIILIVAEVILFFNPFARLLFGIVRKERENSCDDNVLAQGFDAREYSEALYLLGRYHTKQNSFMLAATGNGKKLLLDRVKRILNRRNSSPSIVKPLAAFFLCLSAAVVTDRESDQVPGLPAASTPSNNILAAQSQNAIDKQSVIIITDINNKTSVIVKEKKTINPEGKNLIVAVRVKKKIRNESQMENTSEGVESVIAAEEPEDPMVITFVDDPEALEFSIIEGSLPELPESIDGQSLHPYVPGSTFYIPQIDSTKIRRKIVHL